MTLLGFVGDVLVDRDDPPSAFSQVAGVLAATDVLYANCEGPYAADSEPSPTAGVPLTPHPRNTAALGLFHVMSMANNHMVDLGHRRMLETAEMLRAQGVRPVGAGRDLAEARSPAVLDRGEKKIAYLAYASVFPNGYEARADWPGIAPLRAYNHHIDRFPNYWEPGIPGKVISVPHEEDHRNLREDLEGARRNNDTVVVTFHWGDFQQPFHLTDHERRTARFAIDHGADMVIGHHHHILRGVEWYAGKPIFYGLGHFVFDIVDIRLPDWYLANTEGLAADASYALYPREGWPTMPMHPDARMTMLAWVDVGDDGDPAAAGFLPCTIAPDGRVHPHDPASPEGSKVVDYVRRACTTQDLPVDLVPDGEHILGGLTTVRVVPT